MSQALDLSGTYRALHEGVVGLVSARDVVVVQGPDARSYLQGQLSQDLSPMSIGESIQSLLLSPQGKFEAFVRVALIDVDRLVVESDAGQGEVVYARLKRFKLRVKAELEALSWSVLEVRGPKAVLPEALPLGASYVAEVSWPGLVGYDVVGESIEVPSELSLGDPAAFEAARIEAGWPLPGSELTEKTIPQEAGIVERTVSFTKGCYTGQELVARLDARGNNVARRLRGFQLSKDAKVTAGAAISAGDKELGTLTSVAYSPGTGGLVGLGYLRRDLAPPSEVLVDGFAALAVELPIVMSENR